MNERQRRAILLVVCGFAAWLHLRADDYLLPHHTEPDAYVVYQSNEAFGGLHRGRYPLLLPVLDAAVIGTESPRLPPSSNLAQHLAQASDPFVGARRLLGLLALLVVPATWWLARRFVTDGTALLASVLAATSLLFANYAGQARPHAPVTALSTLALVMLCRLARRGTWRDHLLAAGATALAVSAFPTGGLLAPAWFTAALVRVRRDGLASLTKIGVSVLVVAALAAWSYAPPPETVDALTSTGAQTAAQRPAPTASTTESPTDTRQAAALRPAGQDPEAQDSKGRKTKAQDPTAQKPAGRKRDKPRPRAQDAPAPTAAPRPSDAVEPATPPSPWERIEIGTHVIHTSLFRGGGFEVLLRAFRSYDPVLLVGSILGLLALAARGFRRRVASVDRREERAVALAFAVPAFVVPGLYDASMERYFLPLVPVACVIAAHGIASACALARRIPPRVVGATIATIVLLGAVGLPAATAVRFAQLRAAPDTMELAARWILARRDLDESRIFSGLSLPIQQPWARLKADAWWAGSAWDRYQRRNHPPSDLSGAHDIRHATVDEITAALTSGRAGHALADIVREFDADWAVIARESVQVEVTTSSSIDEAIARAVTFAGGTLVHEIDPFADAATARPGMAYYLGESAWTDVWTASALGPAIEILRFDP